LRKDAAVRKRYFKVFGQFLMKYIGKILARYFGKFSWTFFRAFLVKHLLNLCQVNLLFYMVLLVLFVQMKAGC